MASNCCGGNEDRCICDPGFDYKCRPKPKCRRPPPERYCCPKCGNDNESCEEFLGMPGCRRCRYIHCACGLCRGCRQYAYVSSISVLPCPSDTPAASVMDECIGTECEAEDDECCLYDIEDGNDAAGPFSEYKAAYRHHSPDHITAENAGQLKCRKPNPYPHHHHSHKPRPPWNRSIKVENNSTISLTQAEAQLKQLDEIENSAESEKVKGKERKQRKYNVKTDDDYYVDEL